MIDDSNSTLLFDKAGNRTSIDELLAICIANPDRIIADDELGKVVFVGDLGVKVVSGVSDPLTGDPPLNPGGHFRQSVMQIAILHYPPRTVRRQIGAVARTISSDEVFIVREQ